MGDEDQDPLDQDHPLEGAAEDPTELRDLDGAIYHEDETDVLPSDEPPPPPRPQGLLAAVAEPWYLSPFGCGPGVGEYRGTTYPGHSDYSVDFNGTDGRDIGDPVLAEISGRVYLIVWSNGQVHVRDDATGYGFIHAHMQNIRVQVGDRVRRGEQYAELGNAGIGSTGPHLHVNHTSWGDRIQVIIEGRPYSASVKPNDRYRSGPLIAGHCPEEDTMPAVKKWLVGQLAVLAEDQAILDGQGKPLTKAYRRPPEYPAVAEVTFPLTGDWTEIAIVTQGDSRRGYAKGVGLKPASPSGIPPALRAAVAATEAAAAKAAAATGDTGAATRAATAKADDATAAATATHEAAVAAKALAQ